MPELDRILRQTAQRTLAQRVLEHAGRGITIGLIAACLGLLIDRLLLPGAMPLLIWIGLPLLGGACGAIAAIVRRPGLDSIAIHLDRTFRLKDRLATAAVLHGDARHSTHDPVSSPARALRYDAAFAALVEHDAERAAQRVDVRHAAPIRLTGRWGVVSGLAALLALGALFLPETSWGGWGDEQVDAERLANLQQQHAEQEQADAAQRADIARELDDVMRELANDPDLAQSDRAAEQLRTLEELAAQLTANPDEEMAEDEKRIDPQLARDESAAQLTDLADEFAAQADRNQAAADELAQRFAGLPESRDAPMTAQEFREALKRGDFGDAAQILEQINREAADMSESERKALADDLRELGRSLDERGSGEDLALDERRAMLEDALRNQGLDDESIEELLGSDDRAEDGSSNESRLPETTNDLPDAPSSDDPESEQTEDPQSEGDEAHPDSNELTSEPPERPGAAPNAEQIERELRKRNVDEEVARKLARDVEKLREQKRVKEQVEREAREVAEAVKDAADDVEQPQRARDQPDQQSSAQAREQQTSRDESSADERPSDQTGETKPGEEQAREQQSSEAQKPAQEQSSEDRQPRNTTADPRTGASPEQGASPQPESGANENETSDSAAERNTSRDPRDGETSDTDRGAATGQRKDGEEREGAAPRADESPQTPAERLRAVQRQRELAERQRSASEKTREAAQRMAGNMTDAERDRWRPPGNGESGVDKRDSENPPARSPSDFTAAEDRPLDLTGSEAGREPIAQWTGAGESFEPIPGGVQESSAARVHQAQRTAERAVEGAAVPPRYHRLIQRYFGRLKESTSSSGESAP